jgi:hypothetical protein
MWVAWKQLDSSDDEFSWLQYYRDEAAARSSKPWQYENIVQNSYETLQMFGGDPIAAANFNNLYR